MNPYCTIAQFAVYADSRTSAQLSNDTGSTQPAQGQSNVQAALDNQAGELESYLLGRYSLPLPVVDPVLTKWVAVTTYGVLYGRRANKPKGVVDDQKWAEDWVEKLALGKVRLKTDRALQIQLDSSDSMDGSSRFDRLPYGYGGLPSPTGPAKGQD